MSKEAAGGAEEVSPFRTQGVELLFLGGQFIRSLRPSFSDEVTNEVYEAVAVRARLKTCVDNWKRAELRNDEPGSAGAGAEPTFEEGADAAQPTSVCSKGRANPCGPESAPGRRRGRR